MDIIISRPHNRRVEHLKVETRICSTENRVCVESSLRTQCKKKQDKQRKPNPCVPNANHFPLALVGARFRYHRLALGIIDSCWALLVRIGSARVLGYQHVGINNANISCWGYCPNPQRECFRVAVEYRLIGFIEYPLT